MGRAKSKNRIQMSQSLSNSLSEKLPEPVSVIEENNQVQEAAKPTPIPVVEKAEEVVSVVETPKQEEVIVEEKPKKKVKRKSNSSPFIKKSPNKSRTVTIRADLDDILTELFTDPDTGKKISGAKGEMSKLISNALRREFVAMGVADESLLDEIEEY